IERVAATFDDLEARRQASAGVPGLGRRDRVLDAAVGRVQRPAGVDAARLSGRRVQAPTAELGALRGRPAARRDRLEDARICHAPFPRSEIPTGADSKEPAPAKATLLSRYLRES